MNKAIYSSKEIRVLKTDRVMFIRLDHFEYLHEVYHGGVVNVEKEDDGSFFIGPDSLYIPSHQRDFEMTKLIVRQPKNRKLKPALCLTQSD